MYKFVSELRGSTSGQYLIFCNEDIYVKKLLDMQLKNVQQIS